MSGEDLVVIGEVVRPHGVHGAVRVTLQTDRPERFEALRECVLWDPASDARTPGHIRGVRRQGDDAVLLSLAEYDSPEAARALVGRLIALPRAQALPAPPGHAYPWQLAGCRVELDVRIGGLKVASKAFDTGLADATKAARSATEIGAGVQWHFAPAIKLVVQRR